MGSISGAWDPSRVHGIHPGCMGSIPGAWDPSDPSDPMVKVPWSHAVLMLRGTKIIGKSLQILRVFRIYIYNRYIYIYYIICVYIYIYTYIT